ncbi:MAG TPA: nitronate monooxygenase [Anaerolineae bacterium]|nr:nitronate monooxygenase [Anaerolineae bacterium]
MIHTVLCDLLGIRHPIIQGGMAWVSDAELVVAVSEAGGLGVIGSGNAPLSWVAAQIDAVQARTEKAFGVNIPLFSPYVEPVMQLCIEKGVPVVTTGAGSPGPYIDALHDAGIIILPVVASVALARRLARQGADALIVEGQESGGHIGDVSTMPLIPQVVDAVDIPVIAAGGIADGRGLAAALALGAVGVQMGTRFICTVECTVHPNYKEKIVQARDRSTTVTGQSLGHPVRTIKNKMSREMARLEQGAQITEEELIAFGTGKLRLAAEAGDMDHGSVMSGQVSGLIDDVVPCQTLLERIVSVAEQQIETLVRFRVSGTTS